MYTLFSKDGVLRSMFQNPVQLAASLGLVAHNYLAAAVGATYETIGSAVSYTAVGNRIMQFASAFEDRLTALGDNIYPYGYKAETLNQSSMIAIGNNIATLQSTDYEDVNVIIGEDVFNRDVGGGADVGVGNVIIGIERVGVDTNSGVPICDQCTIIGSSAGVIASGDMNQSTIIGVQSCSDATFSGSGGIVAVGTGSGRDATFSGTQMFDTMMGHTAGRDATLGGYSVLLGPSAGRLSDMDRGNICIGWTCGQSVTAGADNVMIGRAVGGGGATIGADNIIIGEVAASGAVSGNDCIVIGESAGANLNADRVVLIGNGCATTATNGRLCFGSAMEALGGTAPTLPNARYITMEWNGTVVQIPCFIA